MWQVLPVLAGCALVLAAGVQAVRAGLHGLRGGTIGLPNGRTPYFQYVSGPSARVAGAFCVLLGLALAGAGALGLASVAYDLVRPASVNPEQPG